MNRNGDQIVKFARFERNEETFNAMVEDEKVRVIKGSVFEGYEPTEDTYPLTDIALISNSINSLMNDVITKVREKGESK